MLKSLILLMGGILFIAPAQAVNNPFNHDGLKKGTITESCYHEPCSVARIMGYEIMESDYDSHSSPYEIIKLRIVGGSRNWDSEKIDWNHDFHNVYVTCSLNEPSLQMGSQITRIPINPEMVVPGVLYSDTNLYLHTCHNSKEDSTEVAKKYGYNVTEF